jgi:hypothetical protein
VQFLIGVVSMSLLSGPLAGAATINPNSYPAADEKELGQLLWVLKLADQDIADFSNFQSVDEQGVSACRYSVAFSAYFLAAEQYHKFPAWQETIKTAQDRLIHRMIEKRIWQYWEHESPGVTKFEPNMDRPYPARKDPVAYRNIMYSGHLGQMINLYQMLYNDRKWDAPGSIVFKWDDHTQFTYDNRSLQEAMFLQMINNPVPGIECEPNAIFPACNTHPMLSWLLYDQMHGSRYFDAAHPLFDNFFESQFINPQTHAIGAFYLLKQGWVFSSWNPRYGNKMDPLIQDMIKNGANFNSSGNDGWIGTFMHAWNPKSIERLYPYIKKAQVKLRPDGSATLKNDSLTPDAYYGFFVALAAELGDEPVRKGLLKTIDQMFSPVWTGAAYHYPFADKAGAVNLAADDAAAKPLTAQQPAPGNQTPPSGKPAPKSDALSDAKGGPCCKALQIKGHGDANNMKTLPQHSDLSDRLIAMARALPKDGLWTLHNKPFDNSHFAEPAIAGVELSKTPLKRAIYDRSRLALIVSTRPAKSGVAGGGFKIINLMPAKTYTLSLDGKMISELNGVKEYNMTLDGAKAHDLILNEHQQ